MHLLVERGRRATGQQSYGASGRRTETTVRRAFCSVFRLVADVRGEFCEPHSSSNALWHEKSAARSYSQRSAGDSTVARSLEGDLGPTRDKAE